MNHTHNPQRDETLHEDLTDLLQQTGAYTLVEVVMEPPATWET